MKKLDITKSLVAVDRHLQRTDITPLQRQLLENYKRHSRSELSGKWENIFEPDMIVEDPYYLLRFKNEVREIKGQSALKEFYRNMGAPVIVHQNQEIYLGEDSFTSFSWPHQYMTGQQMLEIGEKVDDPDGYYVRSWRGLTLWNFDKRGRLIGENGGELGLKRNYQVSKEEFITPEEAREKLEPLIRPLPKFV